MGGGAHPRDRTVENGQRSDVAELARADVLLAAERRVLEMVARGEPLPAALDTLATSIEKLCPGMLASVLLLDAEGVHLCHGAAPSLPSLYTQALDGFAIGPSVGSCGTAAYRNETVVAEDIAADPRWAPWRELALRHGLRACWSAPIRGATSRVLGTFALYYREPRAPQPEHLALIDAAAHVAGIAIERHRHDAERTALIEDLQRAVRFTEMFVGVLGHDLRNPLGAIVTAAQVMLRAQDPALAAKLLPRVLSSGGRMSRMIDELLDFTRLRLGQGLPILRGPLDLAETCAQVIEELTGAKSAPRDVRLRCSGDTTGRWDRDRMMQLVSNLVGNALQHGTKDEPVLVTIDGESPATISLRVDNGGRLPAELLPGLFDPFTRPIETTRRRPGLGLGLFISRHVARAHGGDIEVETSATGTAFTVRLPRAAEASSSAAVTFAVDAQRPTPRTVVIIEDDVDVRETVGQLLSEEGYTIVSDGGGKNAVEILRRAPRPCVLLLDMTLPDQHGSLIHDAMQADPELRDIPVLVSTGDPKSAPSGVLILKKPVDAAVLLKTVSDLFQREFPATSPRRR